MVPFDLLLKWGLCPVLSNMLLDILGIYFYIFIFSLDNLMNCLSVLIVKYCYMYLSNASKLYFH